MDENKVCYLDGGQPEKKGLSRRDFLSRAWWAAAGVVLIEGGIATLASLWPRVEAGTFGAKFRIPIKELPQKVGDIDATYLGTGKFYISRVEKDGILVLYRKCTHLGCVVPWRPDENSEDKLAEKGRFNCPCHASIFDRYGTVKGGPAPRHLDIFKVTVERNEIVVDTGSIIKRTTLDPSQIVQV